MEFEPELYHIRLENRTVIVGKMGNNNVKSPNYAFKEKYRMKSMIQTKTQEGNATIAISATSVLQLHIASFMFEINFRGIEYVVNQYSKPAKPFNGFPKVLVLATQIC